MVIEYIDRSLIFINKHPHCEVIIGLSLPGLLNVPNYLTRLEGESSQW